MKKILLAVILVFCFSNVAKAESWILWEMVSFKAKDSGSGFHDVIPRVFETFPTFGECSEYAQKLYDENTKNDKHPLSFSKRGFVVIWQENEKGFTVTKLQCLPDTIDPRK